MNAIKELREKSDMSIYELAKRCDFMSNGRVMSKYVSDAESGKYISVYRAIRIFQELKKFGVCTSFNEVFWLDDLAILGTGTILNYFHFLLYSTTANTALAGRSLISQP